MRSEAASPARLAFLEELAADVRAGMGGPGAKRLPSRYLYDDLGSALFEAIGFLPEYGLTRADERILRAHAGEIVARLPGPITVAELGSGSGRKTRWILEALAPRGSTTYYPIDISRAALARCALELGQLPSVRVEPVEEDYLRGLSEVAARRVDKNRLLLLFLGSTIGNFEPAQARDFIREIGWRLRPGDGFLLGTDLLKPVPTLLAAYDDTLGVTAAFNLNLLLRLNRELDADFDPGSFAHEARWSAAEKRIEMHLVARRAHAVQIRATDMRVLFRERETIWTESSYKFEREDAVRLAKQAGFECSSQWVDREWPFAESLLLRR
ncbi:MAG: L-histidine N(alpha)-methyltransferase [Candidatus Eisenbacteria bacterium]|uniref:L-histidine N(Alpha)-methyltransferase n=1 Tax=Eiseniibacteriota bacterium TaxID=2212470 RepID=A0A538T5F8_UNCEI|nr:MAG: L-histidine N(alpha)-methyltransferase [Candidatus Eisenbacteria bacterium]